MTLFCQLFDQSFPEICAELNFIRSNLHRFPARFREVLFSKRFQFLDASWIEEETKQAWQIAVGIERIYFRHQWFQILLREFPGQIGAVALACDFRDHESRATGGKFVRQGDS